MLAQVVSVNVALPATVSSMYFIETWSLRIYTYRSLPIYPAPAVLRSRLLVRMPVGTSVSVCRW
jgi:hypothetical protein